ncbi:MAG TPA: 16S rRNA (cytosine(1402)-N(4))-methyltransferase RsmH, partial [Sedimentisphaerales bacterium]|nr:16S rRNA (cytosine(1402)-N(4))-methyltransferase RsmH [Sedimentisphaerales bacterium]
MTEQGLQKSGDGGYKRRKRYSGTHPKKFGEKYKELNLDKYPDVRDHLRAKGKTPAGTHVPIMVEEVMSLLKPAAGMVVADCTLGYGGHASVFMDYLGVDGKLVGFDVDSVELEKTKARLAGKETPLVVYNKNFAGIASVIGELGIDGFDIIFADLGVSSMQVDDPSRGISYKNKGPLDMRMDPRLKQTGMDILMKMSQEQLSKGLLEFSDEPDHEEIAAAIIRQREISPITQTSQLIRLIFDVKKLTIKQWKDQQMQKFNTLHPAARTFQALRIMVNDELGA